MTSFENLNMGTCVFPYFRPILILNNSGFGKDPFLDEVGMYDTNLLRNLGGFLA